MNEMYSMSIDIHDFGVFALFLIIVVNMVMLNNADDMLGYARKMRIYMPFSASMIAVIIFTGVVMMAAKHLDFSLPNIVMIVFSIVLIGLESKRYGSLKHIDRRIENVFAQYKSKAMKYLGVELLLTVLISIWMFLL